LSNDEAKLLSAAAAEFRAEMTKIKGEYASLIAGKANTYTDTDRKRLSDLADRRDQIILGLAARLLQQLGPTGADKLLRPNR
jgi:hypothetical protein